MRGGFRPEPAGFKKSATFIIVAAPKKVRNKA